ncbi:MAG TPA: hypothetical protein H9740_00555 [Candidatus Hungatella pullicola]|nr:hypothetical protein [Candidatus Hungatella pullicola]
MSDPKKLSQKEAEELLHMLKKSLAHEINFPLKGDSSEFDVVGIPKKEQFVIRIYRGKIDRFKYEIGARIKKDGILLLELHINPSRPHRNPDGKVMTCSHWHVYREKYGRRYAFPACDINSEDFIENTMLFLEKFNVIEKPIINMQLELL